MAESTEKAGHSGRKVVVGEVVSNRMNKTIVVEAIRKKSHPLYGRVVSQKKKFYAHDEKNEAKVGDKVAIAESRPLSARKRWVVTSIVEKAKEI